VAEPEAAGQSAPGDRRDGDSNLWVGGRGAVLAWDGTEWSEHVPHLSDIIYHALLVRSPNDVWAGGTRLTWEGGEAVETPVLFHYDGGKWTEAVLPAAGMIKALDGAGDAAFLVQGDGDIARLDRGTWVADHSLDVKVRALWVHASGEVWAMGEDGFMAHRTAAGWKPTTASMAGEGAPFGADRHYIGVWGSASDDVWAVFETMKLEPGGDIVLLKDAQIGFSHWDGATWTVELVQPMHCPSNSEYPGQVLTSPSAAAGNPGMHALSDRDSFAARRGALMAGRSGGDILASVGGGRCLWHYDGTTWDDIVQQYAPSPGNAPYLNAAYPLGKAPAVGATSSGLLLAGEAGQLISFDPEVALPAQPYTELNPQLGHLFLAARPSLEELWLRDGERYALADGRPATWTAGGWVSVDGPPGSLDPTTLYDPEDLEGTRGLHKLHVDHDGDLWAFGGNHFAYAARYSGTEWTEVAVEPTADWAYDSSPYSVWSSPAGEVWMSTRFDLRRYSGGAFELVETPVPSGFTGSVYETLTGFDAGQVLVGRSIQSGPGQYKTVLYRIDGEEITIELEMGGTQGLELMSLPPDRAMMIRWDGKPYVYDGATWETPEWTEPPIPGLWYPPGGNHVIALDTNDMFVLAADPRGSHVFHFDGATWTQLFSADRLWAIASDGETLWVVGPQGATARAALAVTPE
jgi:hypothetical protein